MFLDFEHLTIKIQLSLYMNELVLVIILNFEIATLGLKKKNSEMFFMYFLNLAF